MDQVTARNEPLKPFAIPDEGQHQCVLADVIDLGYHNKEFGGISKGFKQNVALVFQLDADSPDTEKRFEISKEFQVSMFNLANLRKFLEQWRGKSYSEAEAEAGAPLHLLEGANGLMQIEHVAGKANPDRTYANILSITKLPGAMEKIVVENYVRNDKYWQTRKGLTHEATQKAAENHDFSDFPAASDSDPLPF